MVIDMMDGVATNILMSFASGFLAKRISNHYDKRHRIIEMKSEERKLKIAANAKNQELIFTDLQDARKHSYKFARRAIVLSIFWLSAIILFSCAYLSIPIVVPIDQSVDILWGLFRFKTTELQSAHGFVFDYKTTGKIALSIIGLYMGGSACKG